MQTKAMKLMKQATQAKSRRQLRLIRGKFESLMMSSVSIPLVDSALAEFDRIMKATHTNGLPY